MKKGEARLSLFSFFLTKLALLCYNKSNPSDTKESL